MKRIVADIGDHFNDRIRQVIEDTTDTCGHADLTLRETACLIAGVMVTQAARACSEFKMPSAVFIRLCALAYEGREPRTRTKKRPAGGPSGRS
jgi:hypothetical protein